MAGGNPLAPPGGVSSGAMPGAPVAGSPPGGAGRQPQIGRAPFNGAGAAFLAPQPQGGPQGNGSSLGVPPSQQGQPFADVHQNLRMLQARVKDNTRAQEVLDHLRVELDQLMDQGDMIRPEHVIEAAGRLVGHGIGAAQLAQLMSDMPAQGGQGLASWIRMHDVTVSNAEQQLAQQNAVMRHQLGVASIKSLAASHIEQASRAGAQLANQTPEPQGNALSPSGSGDASEGGMNA